MAYLSCSAGRTHFAWTNFHEQTVYPLGVYRGSTSEVYRTEYLMCIKYWVYLIWIGWARGRHQLNIILSYRNMHFQLTLSRLSLKRFRIRKRLFTGTVPANKNYVTGTVPANKSYVTGTVWGGGREGGGRDGAGGIGREWEGEISIASVGSRAGGDNKKRLSSKTILHSHGS